MFDWFTFIAQIVNFLILVFLLKHFLFGRIVKAMDERQKRMSDHLNEAQAKEKAASEELTLLQQERKDFILQRDQLLQESREKAEQIRSEMVQEARQEVQKSKQQWNEAIEKQKQSFLDDLRSRTGQEIYAVSSRVLKDLANEDLEQHIIEAFINQIDSLEDEERGNIKNCLQASEEDILIQSAFDIPPEVRSKISAAIKKNFDCSRELKFESSSQLSYGIELVVDGFKVGWSLENYLDEMQERVKNAFVKNITEKV